MKKLLALVLALVMVMSLCITSNAAYSDQTDVDLDEAVAVMSAVGVFEGADGKFSPKENLTREQAAKLIAYLDLGKTVAEALPAVKVFNDVEATRWSAKYVAYCADAGYIAGVGDGNFDPAGNLTGYAFGKMILCVLGYDAKIENFVGSNWQIAVAKLMTANDIADGIEASAAATLTREQAAQYCLDALQASMVEYATKGTEVTINGAVVATGASKATAVANKATTETIADDNELQLGEKLYTKLVLDDATADAFGRPAVKWTYKGEKVGTYTGEADATYTTDTKLGTIYADLGLNKAVTATKLEDGKAVGTVELTKGDDTKLGTGNGTLVECYVNSDKDAVTIIIINTYVDTVASTTAATASKDAYITLTAAGKFETDDKFEDDDVVLYTKADDEIETVKLADKVSGEATKIVTDKSVDIDGTTYKFAKAWSSTVTKESKYDLYLDNYGYAIYADELEASFDDYALVLAINNGDEFNDARVKLLTAAGKVVTYDTAKKYVTGDGHSSDAIEVAVGQIVTYAYDEADQEVTLYATGNTMVANNAKTGFELTNSTAAVKIADDATVYANSKTVFVVKDSNGDYTVYTGIKAVPTIKANNNKLNVAYYCKDAGDMATVMFIDASASGVTIESDSSKLIYIAAASKSNKITDKAAKVDYYTYNAVVDGEITTVKVADGVTIDGVIYGGATYNAQGIITALSASTTTWTDKTGTNKLSGEYNVKLGDASYTVADDAAVFVIDEDGEITKGSINSVTKDENDTVKFSTKDGMINKLFIQKVKNTVATYTLTVINTDANATYTYKVNGGAAKALAADGKITGLEKDDTVVVTVAAKDGFKLLGDATYTPAAVTENKEVDVNATSTEQLVWTLNNDWTVEIGKSPIKDSATIDDLGYGNTTTAIIKVEVTPLDNCNAIGTAHEDDAYITWEVVGPEGTATLYKDVTANTDSTTKVYFTNIDESALDAKFQTLGAGEYVTDDDVGNYAYRTITFKAPANAAN